VGFLLGVLLVLFQGILGGAYSIKVPERADPWILYALMFGPKATVAVEDAYSGGARWSPRATRAAARRLDAVERRLRRDPAVRDPRSSRPR